MGSKSTAPAEEAASAATLSDSGCVPQPMGRPLLVQVRLQHNQVAVAQAGAIDHLVTLLSGGGTDGVKGGGGGGGRLGAAVPRPRAPLHIQSRCETGAGLTNSWCGSSIV
jgi:hypothetical protein